MCPLNELIEQLYQAGVEEGRLATSPTSIEPYLPHTDSQADVSRLLRVLTEMSSMLRLEDQPEINPQPPTEEARLLILNHWESMMQKERGIRQHMQSLDQDIIKMQPWGNFDVMKVDQLHAFGCHLRFWTIDTNLPSWDPDSWIPSTGDLIVSRDGGIIHLVTVTLGDQMPNVPIEAQEVEICPCPISTLIMLQTRDKDSLRKLDTLLGDYALCHYGEVYTALRQVLPEGTPLPQLEPEHRSLRHKLQQLFHR